MSHTASYIFAGGGSGGHLIPGIAIADELRRRNASCGIAFVGSERPVERTILDPTGYEHHPLPVEPLRTLKTSPWRFLRRNWRALNQARDILRAVKPRWVIGLGGYISAPTVWAARRLGIPILLLEQNVIPGAATRWLAGYAQHICLSFAESQRRFRSSVPTVVTGNPVRHRLVEIAEARARSRRSGERLRTLLILGGSQGAESLNETMTTLLPELGDALTGWRIVHQTGAGRADAVRKTYRMAAIVEDFFPNIADWYAEADLVISRAGATTLAELACVGCPAVLIPYPFAADQHQAANAAAFARVGAADVIEQAETSVETASRLKGPLADLLSNENRRQSMSRAATCLAKPDAAERIAALLTSEEAAPRVLPPPHRRLLTMPVLDASKEHTP